MIRKVSLNEVECIAVREALIEYYQTVSKHVLKKNKDDISPAAYNHHKAIENLKADFTNHYVK